MTYGTITRILDLWLRRQFKWEFVVADVRQPIIGADFLAQYSLLPDLRRKRLVDGRTLLHITASIRITKQLSIETVNRDCRYKDLLRKYLGITKPIGLGEVTHEVRHHILTKGPPTAERPRRLTPEKYRAAKREFETMIEKGICRPSE